MRHSIFDIRTNTWPEGTTGRDDAIDRIIETIDACTFDWSRCIPLLSRREGRFPFPVEFMDPADGALGYVSLRRMWLRPGRSMPTYRTISHELAHVADIYSLSNRSEWTVVTPQRQPIYDLASHFDAGTHPHRWSSWEPWGDRMVEAFTSPFTKAFWDDPKFHYGDGRFSHRWTDVDGVRAFTVAEEVNVFEDVAAGSVHAEGILWAAAEGLIEGFEDGTFRPDAPVTRGQLATIMMRQHGRVDG